MTYFHEEMVAKYGLPDWLPEGWIYKPAGKGKKPVHSIGINDLEFACQPSIAGKQVIYKPYQTWIDILKRASTEEYVIKHPTYVGCSISKDWLYLSNFLEFFLKNYKEGYVIDKDILFRGNKLYSKETCIFVPQHINKSIQGCYKRGEYPLGVSLRGSNGKYRSGDFAVSNTAEEAHKKWQKHKLESLIQMNENSMLDPVINRLQTDILNNKETIQL